MTDSVSLEVILTVFKDSEHQEILGQAHIEQDANLSQIVQGIVDQFGEFHDFAITARQDVA